MSGPVRCEQVTAVPALQLGEGPHWVEEEQALYFVDLLDGSLHRLDTNSQQYTSTKPAGGKPLSLVVPVEGRRGLYAVGYGRDITVMSWDGVNNSECQVKRTLANVEGDIQARGETRFNDGKADPTGRLWAGTMSTECDKGNTQPRHGSLYSLEDGGVRAQRRATDIDISNGLAWNDKLFYYIDSHAYRVDVFDFDSSTGNIANRRSVFDFKTNNLPGLPDGMTIDSAGNLWVACFDGSQILCVDPTTSRLVSKVPLPAAQITSAAWGGRGLDELYVTSAGIGGQTGKPQAGALFRVTGLGARGLPAASVKLDPKIVTQL